MCKRFRIGRSAGVLVLFVLLAGCGTTWNIQDEQTKVGRSEHAVSTQERRDYDSRAIRHYMDGVNAQLKGNYALAALEFQEALRYDSASATIYLDLGDAYIMLHKFDQAVRVLDAGIESTGARALLLPKLGETYYISGDLQNASDVYQTILTDGMGDRELQLQSMKRLAEIRIRQKKYYQVADLYEQIYQMGTGNVEYLSKARQIYLQLGKTDDARRVMHKLREEFPTRDSYVIELAKLFMQADQPDSALSILQQEVTDDSSGAAAKMLGELYFRSGQPAPAYTLLRRFYRGDSTESRVLYYLGSTALNLEHFKEAEQYYRDLIQRDDSIFGGHYGLGVTLRNQEKYGDAIAIMQNAKSKFPDEPEVYEQLGMDYFFTEKYDSAIVHLNTALSLDSSLVRPKHFLAFVYDQIGEKDSAEVMYKDLLKISPGEPLYLNNLAYLYATRQKKLQQALELVNRALEREPENPSYLDTKGWIYYQMGSFKKARRFLQKALTADSTNTEVLEHFGDVLQKLGDHQRARQYYQRVLSIDPDNEAIRQKLE